ncbi:MAG: amidohydrolase family protein [Deltaproteobacteria bacterium]|nr:MAG: amidohydrolase family protein [Deltaproteobacteria bacterium]
MLIARAEIEGVAPLDVRVAGDAVVEIGAGIEPVGGETVLDAAGGALIPGLHDHHLHLFALARAASSVRCGPPEVRSPDGLARALAAPPTSGTPRASGDWIRGVGYHESVAGELDRARLDALVPDRPVRIQQRSGALWVLNSCAIARLGLDAGADAPGVERDAVGRATGRLLGLDAWLRERIREPMPSLRDVGRRLARFGVTGVTDATVHNGRTELGAFVAAAERGDLPQRLLVMGARELPVPRHASVERGALKLVLSERELPDLDALRGRIELAHAEGRAVAVHCVTRVELVLAASALAAAGARPGDRIEHAAVAPPDAVRLLAALPVTVVTQPHFIRERGDAYAIDVDEGDRPWLYRGRGFLRAGLRLGAGTDAPFGDPDPWLAMRAACERRTASGLVLGPDERLTPERALALFSTPPHAPGGVPRRIEVGARADLCLLDRPWSRARLELSSELVAATVAGGALIWVRETARTRTASVSA